MEQGPPLLHPRGALHVPCDPARLLRDPALVAACPAHDAVGGGAAVPARRDDLRHRRARRRRQLDRAPGGHPGPAPALAGLAARHRRAVRLPRPLLRGAAPRAAGGGRADQLPLAAADRAVLGAAAGRAGCGRGISAARPSGSRASRSCSPGGGGLELRGRALPGYLAALAAAFVWAGYSVLSARVGAVPTDAVAGFCLATAALSLACHLAFEATVWPRARVQWARDPRPRPRAGGRRLLPLGHRREARRHAAARGRRLRGAHPLDARPRGGRPCPPEPGPGPRLRAHRSRRWGGASARSRRGLG